MSRVRKRSRPREGAPSTKGDGAARPAGSPEPSAQRERRSERRSRVHHLASVSANGWTSLGRTLDVSSRGLCVELGQPLPSSRFVDVSLGQRGAISNLRARVVRRTEANGRPTRLGLALVDTAHSLTVHDSERRRRVERRVADAWMSHVNEQFMELHALVLRWLGLLRGNGSVALEGDSEQLALAEGNRSNTPARFDRVEEQLAPVELAPSAPVTPGLATSEPRPGVGRLPDFLIVGAAKSGTSSLFRLLCRHPQVFGSQPKEPCFFDPAVNLDRGLDWYRGLFAGAEPSQVCGEASTNYTRYPQVSGVPRRIHEALPSAKLIYVMRHPVERAYSHYVHAFSKEEHPWKPFSLSFEAFVVAHPRCLDGSDYELQLKRYYAFFPRERVELVVLDDLERDPRAVTSRLYAYLGVEPAFDPTHGGHARDNVGATFREGRVRRKITDPLRQYTALRRLSTWVGPRVRDAVYKALLHSPYGVKVRREAQPIPLSPKTRALLLERYAPTVDFVEELTGRDLSAWRV